mmetsp:Transcript_21032/g.23394  ORF Transcript_21032/g.23394 Transcript_21032/m.23394 type:complete len:154 (-) Transcript_21032:408-869(-)
MIEILCCSDKNLVNFDNNAASYLNKIIASISSLVIQSYGLNKSVAIVWANTLKEVDYKLEHSFKLSYSGYQHTKEYLIHDLGQGAPNSPALLMFISFKISIWLQYSSEPFVANNHCIVQYMLNLSSQLDIHHRKNYNIDFVYYNNWLKSQKLM